jgi:hypothetical protein
MFTTMRTPNPISQQLVICLYREDFYFVDQFHSSALHSGRCTACCEEHINFANKSAWLMASNVRNEGKFSQITGGGENVPLHIDTPHTKGRGSDLPFEAVLQE